MTSKMADPMPSEVPVKKRKIETQSPEQEVSCKPLPVSRLSSTELLLQMPPNTNTSLPVWECVNSTQRQVRWNVTPYSITIQITPSTTHKAQCHEKPATQPQHKCQPKHHPPRQIPSQPTLHGQGHDDATDLPSASFKLAAKTFYTKPSSHVHICDDFLIGCCQYKLSCERHHTPYPFHWQLRLRENRQWVNVSFSAQVKLEMLYCDPALDTIKLQDMTEVFTLCLDTKKVCSVKYGKARRLSSSSDPESSPYFPTEWSIYWWNNGYWQKYDEEVSKQLLSALEAGEIICRFYIGNQLYEADFSTQTQMNLTTRFRREMRWRPTFRSPLSMQSKLKTLIPNGASQSFGRVLPNLSVDPLQEFSSWYPPVWTLSPDQGLDQGYSLVEVPPKAKAYQSIYGLFHSTVSETKAEIISIEQLQNVFQWDKYRRQKEHMQGQGTSQDTPLERHLFYGTTADSAKEICLHNFDPRLPEKSRAVYGHGSYFVQDAKSSFEDATESGEGGCQHMFLAKVLVGSITLGNSAYSRPPRVDTSTPGYQLYDTCVNRISDPSIFVIFDNCQCYPYYLIRYKPVPDIVNIRE